MELAQITCVADGSVDKEYTVHVYKPISHLLLVGNWDGLDIDEIKTSIEIIDSENGNEISLARSIKTQSLFQLSSAGRGIYSNDIKPIELNPEGKGLDLDESKFIRIKFTILNSADIAGQILYLYGLENGNISRNYSSYERLTMPAGVKEQKFNVEDMDFILPESLGEIRKLQLIRDNSVDTISNSKEYLGYLLANESFGAVTAAGLITPYTIDVQDYKSIFLELSSNNSGFDLITQSVKTY